MSDSCKQRTNITRRKLYQLTSAVAVTSLLPAQRASAQSGPQPPYTQGVYGVEKDISGSVVPVATAVPVFIGHTEMVMNDTRSLSHHPRKIASLAEFHRYFGGAPTPIFDIEEVTNLPSTDEALGPAKFDPMPNARFEISTGSTQTTLNLKQTNTAYALYAAIRLFFENGGGTCYIMSIGSYVGADGQDHSINTDNMILAMEILVKVPEPTLLVIPETTRLTLKDSIKVQQAMVIHCAVQTKDRFAILDVFAGHLDQQDPKGDPISLFRHNIGAQNLDYAAAYYPWVNTTIFPSLDFNYLNLSSDARKVIERLVTTAEEAAIPATEKTPIGAETVADVEARLNAAYPQRHEITKITADDISGLQADTVDQSLRTIVPIYKQVMGEIADFVNCMPPAAGIAGVYARVDATRGVWAAPANVSLKSVVSPTVSISQQQQAALTTHLHGKLINPLRSFADQGVLILGANTLDGNSLDWRYINVRRTMIFLEESIKTAVSNYVFEPNMVGTWVRVSSLIEQFLTGIWKQGGLYGATAKDAFSVSVGLGKTMTPTDILEGIMRITVLVAAYGPDDFIEIRFLQQQIQQQMQ